MVRSWLEEGDGPPSVERVVIDRCVRGLPADAKKYVAQQGPQNIEALIALLENHQVTVSLLKPDKQSHLLETKTRLRDPQETSRGDPSQSHENPRQLEG